VQNFFGRLVPVLPCASATLSALTAFAQQNGNTAEFDLSAKAEIRGQAVRIWMQPPFIVVSVTEGGQVKNWRVEFRDGEGQSASAARLLGALKLGDALVVTGNPSTSPGDQRLRATSISRPGDNLVWQR
jgi:hypothetical protein